MPEDSFSGPLPTITQAEKHISESLHHDVVSIVGFGQRNVLDLSALKKRRTGLILNFPKQIITSSARII